MHELAVCQSLLAEVERIAATHRAVSVSRLVVAVGPLSGVEAPLLDRAFEIARMGGIAQSADLEIEQCPVTVWCENCNISSEVKPNALLCAECGSWKVTLKSGDELLLKSIELEERESAEHTT
jgi:hydrogenase nickel incorporation protein HypA/HybF